MHMLRHISSSQHAAVKHLSKLRLNRDYRYDHQRVLIEGIKLISEVCPHFHVYTIAALDETLLPPGIEAEEILIMPENVFHKISGMHSPEGIAAEIAMPQMASLEGMKKLIAIDGMNDPGNLGTLLRTALALGWDGAYLINESCDPFNEKALRAAKGATFRLPISWGSKEQLLALIQSNKLVPYVADLKGLNLKEVKEKENILLVLGNEAHGASPEIKKLCCPVTIPMTGLMESLNVSVAGSILMYELGSIEHSLSDHKKRLQDV
jgi:RNA methyltransferase, TrmH family